jgi:D-threo-aldose 1-dehydrogenase
MLELPPVVFGATSLGNLFRAIDDSEKSAIVKAWLDAPFEKILIDSAGKYGAGLSLEVIGRELENHGANHDRVLVSNKLAWRRTPLASPEPTFEPGVWKGIAHDAVQDISYDGILRCYDEGNGLLASYPAQLVSVHDPDEYLAGAVDKGDQGKRLDDILAAYRALSELREAEQVKGVGVGAKDWRVIRQLSAHCDFDWVMFANSFTIMQHDPELVQLIEQLRQRNVAIVNSAVFHGGFLLGGDFFNYQPVETLTNGPELLGWRERFWQLCRQFDTTAFQAGVSFGTSLPGIRSIALSSSRADRVRSHVEALSSPPPADFWNAMKVEGLIASDYDYVP